MNLRATITWLQYCLANVVIIVLVPLLALQGMPPIDWTWSWLPRGKVGAKADSTQEAEDAEPQAATPVADQLAAWTGPVLDVTGTWTGRWNMFAPDPDSSNHRIRAEIEYYDGRSVVWNSPDWPRLSCWQRFWTSRELEYVDVLGGTHENSPEKAALWSAFADYLSRKHRTSPSPEGNPKKVRFVVEEAFIASPNLEGWIPMSQPILRDDDSVPLIRKYPVPRELRLPKPPADRDP